jgi:hypothetical protein
LLSGFLLEKKTYCTVQFEHTATDHYWTVSVPYGSILSETDVVNEPLYDEVNGRTWRIDGTEEVFDPDKPICGDLILRRH